MTTGKSPDQTTRRTHPIDIMDTVLKPLLGSMAATSAALSCFNALRRAGYLADAPTDEEPDDEQPDTMRPDQFADANKTTIRPSADTAFWLYEYQKMAINVRGLINRGQSESATRLIDETIQRWQLGCQSKG